MGEDRERVKLPRYTDTRTEGEEESQEEVEAHRYQHDRTVPDRAATDREDEEGRERV
jgi:hypothetical protein